MGKASKVKKLAAAATCAAATATAIVAAPFVPFDVTGASLGVTAGACAVAASSGVYLMSKCAPVSKVMGINDDCVDLECRKLSWQELERLYKAECFKAGGAFVGVFVDGMLAFAIPTMLLSAAISARQLQLTIRKKKVLKKLARELDSSGFDGMRGRKRRYTVGALWKMLMIIVFLGAADITDAAHYIQDGAVELLMEPGSEFDVVTGFEPTFEAWSHVRGVEELQAMSSAPSDFVRDVTGFSDALANYGVKRGHNLTWANLRNNQVFLGPEIALVAVADSFSPPMVAVESAGERVHSKVTARRRM